MEHHKLTFIQRIMVQHANPAKLIIDSIGIVVALYFFWQHDLWWGIILLFVISAIGTLSVWNKKNETALLQTPLGRWMYGQAHPVNFLVRGIGAVVIAYAAWSHSFAYLIIGIILLYSGRQWVLKMPSSAPQ